jgi:serine/threonine protein phosphatase PrpC
MTLRADVAALTHTGAVRPANEDALAVGDWLAGADLDRPKQHTLAAPSAVVVADGMGGHAGGQLASREAARYLARRVSGAGTPEAVATALRDANGHLYDLVERGEGAPGMGTTACVLALRPDGVVLGNVGDSRIYRWRAGELTQLSVDDTPGPKLADGRTAARTTPVLTQSLGGQPEPVPVDAHAEADAPQAGDAYLLVTDGLTDLVGRDAIAARLRDQPGDAAVTALLDDALKEGGRDNVTIALVQLS